ncbi:MAG: hypothetical protein LBP96_02570, partial [Bacteroidales bacterium]|nr:hypothetical protein [Bacteroidales bacterium]
MQKRTVRNRFAKCFSIRKWKFWINYVNQTLRVSAQHFDTPFSYKCELAGKPTPDDNQIKINL